MALKKCTNAGFLFIERFKRIFSAFAADKQSKSSPPPLTSIAVTSAYANNQLRKMRVLSVHCNEDDISSTLERIQGGNLDKRP